MQTDLLPADPAYRRKLFAGYGLALALGSALFLAFPTLLAPLLLSWLRGHEPQVQILLADSLAITFLFGFLPPCLYIIKTGRRSLSEGQYPHSGMRMIFDTPIQRGPTAMRRGKSLVRLGWFGIFSIITGSAAVHFICYKFLTDPFFFIRV